MAQKQTANVDGETVSRVYVLPSAEISAGIDRVLEILHSLPTLKRYGDDAAAIQEAREILEKVKEKL